MGSRRKSVPAEAGVSVSKSSRSKKRKSDSSLQSVSNESASSKDNLKPEEVESGVNNNDLKKRFLIPSTVFMDDVNKAVSKAFLIKKPKKESTLLKGKKSKIPVPVHPPEAAHKGEDHFEAVKAGKKQETLRSCLHIYREVGSVKKVLRWAEGNELEKIKIFFKEDLLEMDLSSGFKRYKSSSCLDHLLEEGTDGEGNLDQAEDQKKEQQFGLPARKLLPMPEVKCFAVTPEGVTQGQNMLNEDSKDLTKLPAEDTTPLCEWSECWKDERSQKTGPDDRDDSHLNKWPSGLLSDVLDSCEAMFPTTGGQSNSWDKFRKRGPGGVGSGDYEAASSSPAKRARMHQPRPEMRRKSTLMAAAIDFDEWDPVPPQQQDVAQQVPSAIVSEATKAVQPLYNGYEPLQDPRRTLQGMVAPCKPHPKSRNPRRAAYQPIVTQEAKSPKREDSNSGSFGCKNRLSIVPRLMMLANYALPDQ